MNTELEERIEIIEWRFDIEIVCIHNSTGSSQSIQISKELIPQLIQKLSKIQGVN